MSFEVEVEFKKDFEVRCPYDRVFDLLSDVPKSVSHFPNMDQLVDLGDNSYRWEMRKIGVDRFYVQTVYGCKYAGDREKGEVKWTPVKGVGNGLVKGKWTIKAVDEETTKIKLRNSGVLEVPLPSLVKFIVAPLVAREFDRLVDLYIANLRKTFEKPAKKSRKQQG